MMPAMSASSSAKGSIPAAWAGPDEAGEVAIGDGVPELPAAQVHAADRVTLRAVAGCAARSVEARAV